MSEELDCLSLGSDFCKDDGYALKDDDYYFCKDGIYALKDDGYAL